MIVTWSAQGANACSIALDGGAPQALAGCAGTMAVKPVDYGIGPGKHLVQITANGPGGVGACQVSFDVSASGGPPAPGCLVGGYGVGQATVVITDLPEQPIQEKGIIFCLANPSSGFWLNVRHRGTDLESGAKGSYFQLKGALEETNFQCGGGENYQFRAAANGTWKVSWNGNSGEISVQSPKATQKVKVGGGAAPFSVVEIREGASCGGFATWSAGAKVVSAQLSNTVPGKSCNCK
jgi:hypothetical protein